MIPNASAVIRGGGQAIAAPLPAELPQSEFADALEHYLAGTRRQNVGADSTATDPKATLTQRCKALTALIHRRLAEGDNALDDDELQHLQALLAQLALQQWPAAGDPVLAKLGIAPSQPVISATAPVWRNPSGAGRPCSHDAGIYRRSERRGPGQESAAAAAAGAVDQTQRAPRGKYATPS